MALVKHWLSWALFGTIKTLTMKSVIFKKIICNFLPKFGKKKDFGDCHGNRRSKIYIDNIFLGFEWY